MKIIIELLIIWILSPELLLHFHHAGQLHWLDIHGEVYHGEAERNAAKSQADQYGKNQVRDNVYTRIQHISDHLATTYHQQLRKSVPNIGFSYAEYLQHDFNSVCKNSNCKKAQFPRMLSLLVFRIQIIITTKLNKHS